MFTKPYFAVRYFNGRFFTPNLGSKMPYGSAANRLYSALNPSEYRSVDWNQASVKIAHSQYTNSEPSIVLDQQEQRPSILPQNRKYSGIKIVAGAKAPISTNSSYLLSGLKAQFTVGGSDIRKEIDSL